MGPGAVAPPGRVQIPTLDDGSEDIGCVGLGVPASFAFGDLTFEDTFGIRKAAGVLAQVFGGNFPRPYHLGQRLGEEKHPCFHLGDRQDVVPMTQLSTNLLFDTLVCFDIVRAVDRIEVFVHVETGDSGSWFVFLSNPFSFVEDRTNSLGEVRPRGLVQSDGILDLYDTATQIGMLLFQKAFKLSRSLRSSPATTTTDRVRPLVRFW